MRKIAYERQGRRFAAVLMEDGRETARLTGCASMDAAARAAHRAWGHVETLAMEAVKAPPRRTVPPPKKSAKIPVPEAPEEAYFPRARARLRRSGAGAYRSG